MITLGMHNFSSFFLNFIFFIKIPNHEPILVIVISELSPLIPTTQVYTLIFPLTL